MEPKTHEILPAYRRGFTLLELLISISITMLLVGGIVASYNSFNDTQVLKQAGLTLKSNLRLAQVKATAVEKPVGCTQLVGYGATFTASSYATQAQCAPEGLVGTLQTVVLPTGVNFSPVPAVATFAVLTGSMVAGTTIDITLAGRSTSYILQISPNGNIFDMGLQ